MLKISVLDVGHGDFIYAETPLGNNLVIDCGSGNIVPSTFLRNVNTISELQISHLHTDHFDDILGLAEKNIASFRCPNTDLHSDRSVGWKKSDIKKLNKVKELRRSIGKKNEAVVVGKGFGHSVWLPSNTTKEDPNSGSAVTILHYGLFKMLFGSDLPNSGWENLLLNENFRNAISGTTVLKVPHHGRKEGCSLSLFEHISPMLCVISDKSLDKDNVNSCQTGWYTSRSTGCNVVGFNQKAKVLSTRANGSIHIQAEHNGTWSVYPRTIWK